MKIKNIMLTNIVSVDPNTSISDVADKIFSNRFHGLPVLEAGKVVGIITEDDFFLKNYDDLFLPVYIKFIEVNKVVDNLPEEYRKKIDSLINTKAKDIMTKDCVTVSPEMNVSEMMSLVKKTKFTTFPVADQKKNILGIVTLSDVLGTVKTGSERIKKALSQKSNSSKFSKMVGDFNLLWNEKLVVISRKRINALRGVLIIGLIEAIIIFFLEKYLG